jgi:hypothetical protein
MTVSSDPSYNYPRLEQSVSGPKRLGVPRTRGQHRQGPRRSSIRVDFTFHHAPLSPPTSSPLDVRRLQARPAGRAHREQQVTTANASGHPSRKRHAHHTFAMEADSGFHLCRCAFNTRKSLLFRSARCWLSPQKEIFQDLLPGRVGVRSHST